MYVCVYIYIYIYIYIHIYMHALGPCFAPLHGRSCKAKPPLKAGYGSPGSFAKHTMSTGRLPKL